MYNNYQFELFILTITRNPSFYGRKERKMRNSIFFSLLFLFLLVAPSALLAQEYEDVVYLKNGSVIHGTIIEQVPGVTYTIKTNFGDTFVFKVEEIEKITKEPKVVQKEEPAETQREGIATSEPTTTAVNKQYIKPKPFGSFEMGIWGGGNDYGMGSEYYYVYRTLNIGGSFGIALDKPFGTIAFAYQFGKKGGDLANNHHRLLGVFRIDIMKKRVSPIINFKGGLNITKEPWFDKTLFLLVLGGGSGVNFHISSHLGAIAEFSLMFLREPLFNISGDVVDHELWILADINFALYFM